MITCGHLSFFDNNVALKGAPLKLFVIKPQVGPQRHKMGHFLE